MEAVKAVDPKTKKNKGKASEADVAVAKIRQLYRIEAAISECSEADKYLKRQELSVPILNEFKAWLEKNVSKVMKGSQTRKAMEYTLNQWEYLIGYCDHGYLNISNAKAENAIRPFAVGRKAWLFADTTHGARASATCYSLIETAKASQLEPYAYIRYVLEHIGSAETLEEVEALLPWNVPLEKNSKIATDYGKNK
ncbi:IS66 family transposase [Ketobacter sp. MCCC 1A13808]|nr:IS66 family transposase [Ketobacter sp. MCCC 1A13808]